jgi:hypothetical protein
VQICQIHSSAVQNGGPTVPVQQRQGGELASSEKHSSGAH